MSNFEMETKLKEAIIERLDLNMSPEELLNDALLFGEVGLDSLDSLEIVIAIGKEFNVQIRDEDFEVLASINTICDFIRSKQAMVG